MQTEIAANLIMSDAERDSQSNFASIRSTDGMGVSEMAHRWRRPSPETRWFYFDLSSSERTERSRRLKDLKRQPGHINVAVRRERRFGGEGTQLGFAAAAAAALLRQICGRQNEREREREVAEMFELFVLGCTGVVVFLHSAMFFFRALCHRRLTARPLRFPLSLSPLVSALR
ncbi:hypothetical protein B296_00026710 [Ensete ventricosum]|uniref:Uncharacterized protein n=1 Tax=Ensete ventricosum TaxID=4639 RepID=A0A426YEH7_ENSVE|nr:hypothetical protein B296_00026710 [Ensete ventricosum]